MRSGLATRCELGQLAVRGAGKRKEAGHYSGLLKTTLKFFAASCTTNNEIRIPQPGIPSCHQLWLHGWGQTGDAITSAVFDDPGQLLAEDFGAAFGPGDEM